MSSLLGVGLMIVGAAAGSMATVFAATAYFAAGAVVATVDLLSGR
jgi:hypothetical protein